MPENYFEQSDEYKLVFDICEDDPNKVYAKVFAPAPQLYDRAIGCLNTSFSFKDPGAANNWEYKHGFYDGIIRLFDKSNNRLDLGLVTRACQMLRKGVPELKIEVAKPLWKVFKRPAGDISHDDAVSYLKKLKIKNTEGTDVSPYDHQYSLFERGVNGRRMSMVACTGAGKSLAQYALSRWFVEVEKKKTLIIVPSAGLVEQMYHDFRDDYGWTDIDNHCTLIYADSKDALTQAEKNMLIRLSIGEEAKMKDVVISTWQSLVRKDPQFFTIFGAVIVDEAHGAKADELRRVVNQCVNADWKLGVSGTIPDSGLDAALIEGSLGRREEIVRSKELIAKGILTPVEIHSLMLPYDMDLRPFVCRQDYRSEFSLVTGNGSRQQVVDVMINAGQITTEQNTLILFKHKESIDLMKEFIEKNYPQFKIYIIKGEVKAIDRERYRGEIERSIGNIVLATFGTMKQGVNIKLLHNLMFAEFSKSMYEIIQSIGRILRKHPKKAVARVFDIVDDCSYITRRGAGNYTENYAMEHYKQRLSYYMDENFPVVSYTLPFFGTVDPGDLEKKKKNADKKSASKKPKPKKVDGKGLKSAFMT